MTLVFLGVVPEARLPALVDAAARVVPDAFDVVLDRIGWWPRNRILWLGCSSMPILLQRLRESLNQELASAGFSSEQFPYHPHVTLIRQANCAELPSPDMSLRWRVQEFTLVESKLQVSGARYRVLARWPLECPRGVADV